MRRIRGAPPFVRTPQACAKLIEDGPLGDDIESATLFRDYIKGNEDQGFIEDVYNLILENVRVRTSDPICCVGEADHVFSAVRQLHKVGIRLALMRNEALEKELGILPHGPRRRARKAAKPLTLS
jgi:hypothetical protein